VRNSDQELSYFFLNLKKIITYHNDYVLTYQKTPRLYLISKKIYDEFKNKSKIINHIKNDYLNLKRWSYLPNSDRIQDYNDKRFVLSLRVSEECNLSCRYCYNKRNMLNKDGVKYMSKKIAKKSLDFFISHFNQKHMSIIFSGGEPLLNFSTVKYVLNYLKNTYKDREFEFKLSTNGTILNKEIINEIIKNDIKVTVSIDFPILQHNFNRPFKNGNPSFEIIRSNLMLLLKHISPQNITLRTVISSNGKFTPEEIIYNFYKLNLPTDNLYIQTEFGKGISFYKKNIINRQKKALIEKHRKYLLDCKNNSKLYKREIFGNILYTIITGRDSVDECPAVKNGFTINPKGEIYLCDISVNKEKFYLGNIKNGFDNTRLKIIKEIYLKYYNECLSCWAFSFCSKFCPLIRPNKDIFFKNCAINKKEFIDEIRFFLNLNYNQIKKIILSAINFTKDKDIISRNRDIDLYIEIYKFLNRNNKYIKPINIFPV